MFSEALRILDQNTLKYMIEELQKEQREQKEQQKKLEAVIEEKDAKLEAKDNEIADLKRLLGQYESIEEIPPRIPKESERPDKSILDV